MDVADELCNELFRLIDKQEQYAKHLMALAGELEEWRKMMTKGQLVGNTATIVGSVALIGTGIATFLTGGLAAPLLAAAAGATGIAGTVTSVSLKLLEKWKSSKTMKKAEDTAAEIEKIKNHIEMLQKKLAAECENLDLSQALSADEVQCEITVSLLQAMASQSGRDLTRSCLRRLLRSDDDKELFTHAETKTIHTQNMLIITSTLVLLISFGWLKICMKTAASKGAKYSIPLFMGMKGMALPVKTVLKGLGQTIGGGLGLLLTIPDVYNNCKELIKNEHHTEATSYLKTKAKEITESVKKLKKHLNELQEMLSQIPEMECHMDLAQKMLGSETYTQGTICIKYKQSQKKEKSFILLCNKDIGTHRYGFTDEHTSDNSKTKRQKSTIVKKSSIVQECASQNKLSPEQSSSEESSSSDEEEEFLPTITMSNVRSLPNKLQEIKEMMEYVEYFDSDLIVFTETWLKRNSADISLMGYESCRQDRDPELTGKRRGGGLMLFVNKIWAREAKVTKCKMTKDYELMVVCITPHGHPKNAKQLRYIIVYVPGCVNKAASNITKIYKGPLVPQGAHFFLLGDFNNCEIKDPVLEQYVTCPTRGNSTLDKCYGNVPGAYISFCRPPLGQSDHNVIRLIPKGETNKNILSKLGECKHDHTQPKKK